MELNEEQQYAMNLYKEGASFFLTGPGGVGKSYVIRAISQDEGVHVTALTGCAAVLLENATTLHAWAGIGLGNSDLVSTIRSVRSNVHAKKRWLNVKTLVIDEVSMLTGDLFDKLNNLAKALRKNTEPFGGIQLILSGDLYQLPPIDKDKGFVFECDAWHECMSYVVTLSRIVRQTDTKWQTILNKLRTGVCDNKCLKLLTPRIVDTLTPDHDGIVPTRLFCKRVDVDEMNARELLAIRQPIRTYEAVVRVDDPKTYTSKEIATAVEWMDKYMPYKPILKLCIGAQVMLIVNLDPANGLVNGSRGVVTKISGDTPVVKFMNGMEIPIEKHAWAHDAYPGLTREQYPLVLAWAITIHKSQGQTLDSAVVDCGLSVFEYGQIYVALSRVKSLDALYLLDFEPRKVMANPVVKEFYESLTE
jgi:ATP-dependent DNA helicase PIF1